MKNIIFILLISAIISSCKNEPSAGEQIEIDKTTTAQQLAINSGIDHWKDVERIKFTFNVGKSGNIVMSRAWTWNPSTQEVQLIAKEDTIKYRRNAQLDRVQTSTDRAFINDVYWLLPQFKLVWDKGTSITEQESQIAPISKDTLNQITILYKGDGGYTPGDAYDIYYDKDYNFKEWAYRKSNDAAITMATTFEDFETFNNITIAKNHRTLDGVTSINFTDIEIIKKR
jgi:hypothetical protein